MNNNGKKSGPIESFVHQLLFQVNQRETNKVTEEIIINENFVKQIMNNGCSLNSQHAHVPLLNL